MLNILDEPITKTFRDRSLQSQVLFDLLFRYYNNIIL